MSRKQSEAAQQDEGRPAERATAARAEQEGTEGRRRRAVATAVVLVVLAAVAGVAFAVQTSLDTTGEEAAAPRGAVDTYALPIGNAEAPVEVTVYEDFLCFVCGQFEARSRGLLKAYAATGDVSVRYQVVSTLDHASEDDYSTRAANALAAVLDTSGPETAVLFHDLLYDHQPAEGGPGLSDEQLVDLAVQAGADRQKVAAAVKSLEFRQWVVNSTDAASSAGLNSTPTVTVDGQQVQAGSVDGLVRETEAAVDDALEK
jgi:protein-disulfide isomerase